MSTSKNGVVKKIGYISSVWNKMTEAEQDLYTEYSAIAHYRYMGVDEYNKIISYHNELILKYRKDGEEETNETKSETKRKGIRRYDKKNNRQNRNNHYS
jgi:hypothetical protein